MYPQRTLPTQSLECWTRSPYPKSDLILVFAPPSLAIIALGRYNRNPLDLFPLQWYPIEAKPLDPNPNLHPQYPKPRRLIVRSVLLFVEGV